MIVVKVGKALLMRRSSATEPSARLRYVEIDANQDLAAGHVDVAESLFRHGCCSCEIVAGTEATRPAGSSGGFVFAL